MGHKFKEKKIAGDRAIFYRDVVTTQSGFNLMQKFPVGTVIPKGTFVEYAEEDKNEAYCVKSARVAAGGTATAIRVEKGHIFQPSDEVFVDNSAKAKIQSIDTNALAYDILHVSPGLSTQPGDVLREVGYQKVGECVVTVTNKVITVPEAAHLAVGNWVRKQGSDIPVQIVSVETVEGVSTITLASAISGLVSDNVLEVVELHEAHEPMGCLYKLLTVEDDAETVDVVVEGRVYARRIQPIHPDWYGGNRKQFLKNNPAITFTFTF